MRKLNSADIVTNLCEVKEWLRKDVNPKLDPTITIRQQLFDALLLLINRTKLDEWSWQYRFLAWYLNKLY